MSRLQRVPGMSLTSLMERQLSGAEEPRICVDVPRQKTAMRSLALFGTAIRRTGGSENPPHVFQMSAVGLKADGRRSLFDIFYFPRTAGFYAVDIRDTDYVCSN